MENQTIINVLIGAVGALIGWVLKSIRESLRDLQAEHKALRDADNKLVDRVQSIELLVVGDYVKNDNLKEFVAAIITRLDRIEVKIDGKADKK